MKKLAQDAKFKHIKLAPIKQVSVDKLTPNPLNNFFEVPSGNDLARLEKDIEERGIIVPLVAKKDGTLLAGHCRLTVAKLLQLKTVPVQYVQQKLSVDEERKFVIMDNVARRHLDHKTRMNLYRVVYPEFETRVLASGNTHGRRSSLVKESSFDLTAHRVSEETGIPVNMVNSDMHNIRYHHKRTQSKIHTDVDLSSKDKFTLYLTRCSHMYKMANTKTRAELDEVVKIFLNFMKNADTIPEKTFVRSGLIGYHKRTTASRKVSRK